MTAQDIRDWAREAGMEVPPRGPLPAYLRSAYVTAHSPGGEEAPPGPPEGQEAGPGGPVVFGPPPPPSSESTAGEGPREQPPQPPRKSPAERARELLARSREPERKRPGPKRKRVTLENLGGALWGIGAKIVTALGEQYLPVSRMMTFESPVAGMVVEDLARGTVVDRMLQPLARLMESGSEGAALIGLPLAAGIVGRYPQSYPAVRPVMAGMMRSYITVAGPKLRELRLREERFAKEMEAWSAEFGMTIDDILDSVFAPSEEVLAHAAANGSAAPAA